MYDVIIVGSGPAGLSAGLYAARGRRKTLILEKSVMGGELMEREMIENYPGFPEGIPGPDLGSRLLEQVMNLGAEIRLAAVEGIKPDGGEKIVGTSGGEFCGRAVILAGGCRPRKLGVPGEDDFANRGVFYCATCDGPAFSGKVVALAGGGDSGFTEALFLARIASRVILLEALPEPGACRTLQDRAVAHTNIQVLCGKTIAAVRGRDRVEGIDLFDVKSREQSALEVDGVLVRVGLQPNTDFLRGTIPLDGQGRIVVNEHMETPIPGIFAAGDIRGNSPGQISTAVGDGATAALRMEEYLLGR